MSQPVKKSVKSKHPIPPAGRKASFKEAHAATLKQIPKTLAKLAK